MVILYSGHDHIHTHQYVVEDNGGGSSMNLFARDLSTAASSLIILIKIWKVQRGQNSLAWSKIPTIAFYLPWAGLL